MSNKKAKNQGKKAAKKMAKKYPVLFICLVIIIVAAVIVYFYLQSKKVYEISFYDEDGTTLLEKMELKRGQIPTPKTPTKEQDSDYTYKFSNWVPELTKVTKTTSYTASYTKTPISETEAESIRLSNFKIEEGKKLSWNASIDADKYEIKINDETPIITEDKNYDISLLDGKFVDNKLTIIITAIKGSERSKHPKEIKLVKLEDNTYSLDNIFVGKGYYAGINTGSMSAEEVVLKLREIISKVEKIPSYGEVRQIFEESDLDINDRNHMRGIYDGAMLPAKWDGKKINREHVWPNSRLGIERVKQSDRSIGSDPHNLRAITPSTNSSRSNHPFNDPIDPSMTYGIFDVSGFTWHFPSNEDKGDVARILLYMVVRWDHLKLVEKPAGPTYKPAGAQMGNIKVLLSWHEEDPVDAFEIQRNNVIYKHQGNRNPFIDNPELFELVYNYFLDKYETSKASLEQFKVQLILLEKNLTLYVEPKPFKETF